MTSFLPPPPPSHAFKVCVWLLALAGSVVIVRGCQTATARIEALEQRARECE